MPDFWQVPTGSMGIGPISAIYQSRFMRYLRDRGLRRRRYGRAGINRGPVVGRARNSTNLTFIINCNLQRLDGPVRGNGQNIQELETTFRGVNAPKRPILPVRCFLGRGAIEPASLTQVIWGRYLRDPDPDNHGRPHLSSERTTPDLLNPDALLFIKKPQDLAIDDFGFFGWHGVCGALDDDFLHSLEWLLRVDLCARA